MNEEANRRSEPNGHFSPRGFDCRTGVLNLIPAKSRLPLKKGGGSIWKVGLDKPVKETGFNYSKSGVK